MGQSATTERMPARHNKPKMPSTDRKFDFGLALGGGEGLCPGGGGRNSVILILLYALMLMYGVDWKSRRHFAPFPERSRPGWRSRSGIPTRCAHYTPVLGGVKCRIGKGLSSLSRFPGRLGLFDFFAAGEFQEVKINFVGQPGVGGLTERTGLREQDWDSHQFPSGDLQGSRDSRQFVCSTFRVFQQ